MLIALVVVPAVIGLILAFVRTQSVLAVFARLGGALVIILSIAFCATNFESTVVVDLTQYGWLPYLILAAEYVLTVYLVSVAVRNRSLLLGCMAVAQIVLMTWLELSHVVETTRQSLHIDRLTLLMILIVGVIGGLICVYAVEYIKDYHRHHPEVPDRRGFFFTVLFVFMSAMFVLVMANDMLIMLFCWELTSLASFLLIGYTRKPEAVRNSMLAININVFGGLMFSLGLFILGMVHNVGDLESLLAISQTPMIGLIVFLISCAALTKSAQMPFSSWLLGAMVAPTPVSAMLHSATMVKAGVYLLLRLAPLLGNTPAGITVTMVGGVSFFAAALLAVSQYDAKRLLAYSTISNLGLIVACAGVGTGESLWAAIMLIVFHAIAKSLLFLSVGSTEYQLGSRNLEDMDGLYRISRQLAVLLMIGISGMFLAPFGMLVSKWAAMKAFLDSDNAFIVLLVAFGSTVTLFYWTKWMGKLIAKVHRTAPTSYIMRIDEKVSLYLLAALVVVVCLLHPLLSRYIIVPYVISNIYIDFVSPIDATNSAIIIFMMCLVFIVPLALIPLFRLWPAKSSLVYMAGENAGDDESLATHGITETRRVDLVNWYLTDIFGEKVLFGKCMLIGAVIMVSGLFAELGGILA